MRQKKSSKLFCDFIEDPRGATIEHNGSSLITWENPPVASDRFEPWASLSTAAAEAPNIFCQTLWPGCRRGESVVGRQSRPLRRSLHSPCSAQSGLCME